MHFSAIRGDYIYLVTAGERPAGDIVKSINIILSAGYQNTGTSKLYIKDSESIAEKSIHFTNNSGNAVSNLLDDKHREAWADMPKDEWKTKANEAILLLEEAGFLMAEKALGIYCTVHGYFS